MKRKSHRSRKWLLVGIALLVLIAAGTTAYLLLRPHSKTVAQVNGTTITQADINRQTEFPLSQTPGIFDIDGGAASKKDVDARNLQAAIERQLLLQEARKRGISVSSATVNSAYDSLVVSYASPTELQDKLKQAGTTEGELKSMVADNLTLSALTKSLVPDSSVTEAKLRAYYSSHKDRYVGAGTFAELKDEIKADYLNDARSLAAAKLIALLRESADIKK
ncbi:MAG: SurA N-terminal domain-containing protein [Actinomycetia bacterium]|nr:SurA N-terminal domain-containing protein [Actinomycetes bacterium]